MYSERKTTKEAVGENRFCGSPYLSVIIPVYNVGSYLADAVESALHSTFRDMEIILVDDGSTDGSSAVCDSFAAAGNGTENPAETRIPVRVIHQENKGLVSARKAGARAAHGLYLTFLDGDDTVEANYYVNAAERLQGLDNQADILLGSFYECPAGAPGTKMENTLPDGLYEGRDVLRVLLGVLCNKRFLRDAAPSVWSKFFRTGVFLNAMEQVYDSVRDGEDILYSASCICRSEAVLADRSLCGYHYRIVNDSMSHAYRASYYGEAERMCRCLGNILDSYVDSHPLPDRDKRELIAARERTFSNMLYRYFHREFFAANGKTRSERFKTLSDVLDGTTYGRAFTELDLRSMKLTAPMKLELCMVQKKHLATAYWLASVKNLIAGQ